MNDRLRRLLLIGAFVVVVLVLGFALYYLFFRPIVAPTPSVPTTPATPAGQLPGAGPSTGVSTTTQQGGQGLPSAGGQPFKPQLPTGLTTPNRTTVLSQQITSNISMSQSGELRGYNPLDGKFYRVNSQGESVPISNQVFNGVQTVNWANSSDKAILSFPDGSNVLYDFTTDKQVTLPQHWEDFNFSPQDDKIVAKSIGNNADNRFLVVSNPDGSNPKAIEELGDNQNKVHTTWSPNNQIVAYSFTGEPLGFDRQQVILVGQNHENFKGLVVEGRDFEPSWSPSGNNVLYSVYTSQNGYKPTLWFSGASGDNINANRTNLSLNTWSDKCAWQSESVVICGVPRNLPNGAGLQRDIASGLPDDLYKIDLNTGTKTNLGDANNASVGQMMITPDGSAAVFTDANSGRLIRFEL